MPCLFHYFGKAINPQGTSYFVLFRDFRGPFFRIGFSRSQNARQVGRGGVCVRGCCRRSRRDWVHRRGSLRLFRRRDSPRRSLGPSGIPPQPLGIIHRSMVGAGRRWNMARHHSTHSSRSLGIRSGPATAARSIPPAHVIRSLLQRPLFPKS